MSCFKFACILTFSVFFAAFGVSGVFALSPGTDSCVECHTKPKYKKEDIGKLKECLACQGMAFIPEGEFIMGTDDRLRDEKPLPVSYAASFHIDRYEVTNVDYKLFVDAAGYPAPDNWKGNNYPPGKGNHPVIFVSWNDAVNYCRRNGKRLP